MCQGHEKHRPIEKEECVRGVEIETAPSRLGLARISVVRGEGSQAGRACIDDYIRATEPVYDYLTQFSGLRAGDLDPAISQHHLTTLKASYLKLRFLADAGCVFVGHGLKKDFRMINMLVPPEQASPAHLGTPYLDDCEIPKMGQTKPYSEDQLTYTSSHSK